MPKTKAPLIFLAPMAGITDSPFRRIVKEINPQVLCVSEFVSTDGLKFGNKKSKRYLTFHESEQPLTVQIFGKRPESFAKAAKLIEASGAVGIDINMGCPARKVVRSFHGAALSLNPELAYELLRATIAATKLPVSVKIRLGWQDRDNLINFAQGLQAAGASRLTVHGRTAKQAYTGVADWEPIYELKRQLKIPVIGNGDLKSMAEGFEKVKNLDGFMIGRAALGNPWVFTDYVPDRQERYETIIKHCCYSQEFYGEKWGMIAMRKHLLSYTKGWPQARLLRVSLQGIERLEQVEEILGEKA